jgi:hypothetical protein
MHHSVFMQDLGDNMTSNTIVNLINNKAADNSIEGLTLTAEKALDWFSHNDIQTLNLAGLNPSEVNCEHLALILRMTANVKDDVSGWASALAVAQHSATLNEVDSNDLLFGLI